MMNLARPCPVGYAPRVGAALDAHGRSLLIDDAAQRLDRRSFAQRQVQRVDVTAAHVEHAADVAVRRPRPRGCALVHQFQLVVAETLPKALLRFQVAHLLAGERGENAAVLQVALDVVLGRALANDTPASKAMWPSSWACLGAHSAFDHVDVAAVAVDDLATVAARGTEADLGGFDDAPKPFSSREQGAGQAGVAGADDASVSTSP